MGSCHRRAGAHLWQGRHVDRIASSRIHPGQDRTTARRPASRYVALIRAINVPGHQNLRMDDVRRAFEAARFGNVRTCLQSGNVIFDSPHASRAAIDQTIRRVFCQRFDAEPELVLRTGRELRRLVESDPFRRVASAGPRVKLYVAFLLRQPRCTPAFPLVSAKEALTAVGMTKLEVFLVSRLKPNGFFGFPNNFIEQALGVPATTRNWSTVTRIVTALGG
jgi:uncharacterized protein (DUF1697 family)